MLREARAGTGGLRGFGDTAPRSLLRQAGKCPRFGFRAFPGFGGRWADDAESGEGAQRNCARQLRVPNSCAPPPHSPGGMAPSDLVPRQCCTFTRHPAGGRQEPTLPPGWAAPRGDPSSPTGETRGFPARLAPGRCASSPEAGRGEPGSKAAPTHTPSPLRSCAASGLAGSDSRTRGRVVLGAGSPGGRGLAASSSCCSNHGSRTEPRCSEGRADGRALQESPSPPPRPWQPPLGSPGSCPRATGLHRAVPNVWAPLRPGDHGPDRTTWSEGAALLLPEPDTQGDSTRGRCRQRSRCFVSSPAP